MKGFPEKDMKKLAFLLFAILMLLSGTASGENGTNILDWFIPAADTATSFPLVTETPSPYAFRFRDGIRWGMNTQQVKALESASMTERTMQDWSVMLTDGKVVVSRFTADLIFMFRDDRLLMTCYEFQKGTEDDFLYLSGALTSVYGEKKEADPLKIKALMDAINPDRYRTEQITRARGWMTSDGTTVFIYFYSQNAFAIMYVSPEMGKNAYQTNGL